jgi:D-alanyl-D-alanine carboxypeptidase (penicillin-binding protein 5/6)
MFGIIHIFIWKVFCLEYEYMRKIIISICMVAVLVMVHQPLNVCADEENLKLYAKAAVLMDADSGRVLYERCGDKKLPMASTTKIMTLIVTLEEGNLDDTVLVSSYAASMPQVRLGMKAGEEYRLKDLLYSMMLESHNDSAVAIAEHVGESVEGFAVLMNNKAKEIGCEDTCYITPNGLDAEKDGKIHSTTAKDLARVMSYCITKSPQKEKFLEITRTSNYSFSNLSGTRSFSCTNHNAFLNMMSGALSGKTGYTGNAGYCYVGALQRDGKTYVVSLLACGWPNHKTYKWSDTRTLMDYGLANYSYKSFENLELPYNDKTKIKVLNAQGKILGEDIYVGVESTSDTGEKGLLMRDDEKVTVRLQIVKGLTAPVAKGQQVGYVSYMIDGEEWRRISLSADTEIKEIDMEWCIFQVFYRCLIKND